MILTIFIFIAFALFDYRRLMTYLHIFQQEEYDGKRFIYWMVSTHSYDKKLSFALLIVVGASLFGAFDHIIALSLCGAGFLISFIMETYFKKADKKPLVFTKRAQRLFYLSLIITLSILIMLLLSIDNFIFYILGFVHVIPFTLPLSVLLMRPYDRHVNRTFRAQAVEKLHRINPYIIAITGSFGKTSVKHILGHLLNNYATTLITPGSVNTEMGIVRIIRERLTPNTQFFVVEMGAYGIGSIARLCALTPPQLSAISAIGHAHYERFKTLNDTARAKFEIAQSAIENDGHVVIHDNVMQQPYATDFVAQHHDRITVCGTDKTLEPVNMSQTKEGLEFDLHYDGKTHHVIAPIYGLHHVDNIVIAIGLALKTGMPIKDILSSLKTLPQITHRLEVKPQDNAYTIIDDSYNSNPKGFASALELLSTLQNEGGRRILVTPGMVELGNAHDEEHEKIAKIAADHVDIALVVLPERIKSFITTFETHTQTGQCIPVNSFQDAQAWLNANVTNKDVVLLENDLPDLYEKRLSI